MKSLHTIVLGGLIAASGCVSKSVGDQRVAKKPNVIVIYTDDQGYGDVSALNPEAKFQTPNMDRLASEGIAFTRGHSSDSVCTPSRYGLLTGRYSWRTELKTGVYNAEQACMIVDGRMTLANLFRDNGYNTAMVGKWHLGMDFPGTPEERDWSQPIQDMPLDKGFDYFYGIPASLNYGILAWFEGRYAKVPPTMYSNKKKNPRHMDYRIMPPYETAPGQSTDPTRTVKKNFEIAEDFIDNQCLTRFTDKAIEWMGGKADEAKQGKPFFLYLPFTSPHYPVCPLPEFHGQGGAGAYGEFVIETDYHIGRILNFLKASGLDENTLIVFTSDNGPESSWPKRLKQFGHDSRGALKEGKRSVYEGGHRVPFLVRWPAGIKEPGRRWNKPVGQIDLMATFAELLGTGLPATAGEDSQSFAPVLLDPKADYDRLPLLNHGNRGYYAITDGDWKLVAASQKKGAELYNLAEDRAEQNNVAAAHPEKVEALTKRLTEIISRGRTTAGAAQPNDTPYWEDLSWMSEADYKRYSAAKEKANAFKPDREVTYKTVGDVELKMQVFEPEGWKISDKRPAVVFFFGGGWETGSPKQFYQQAAAFAEQGIVAFSANYRIKSRNGASPFECVEDAKSAVRWIRGHAAELGVDPSRIIASGGSAGGHIAGATGVMKGCETAGQDMKVSSVPNLMILFNPVLDTTDKGFGADRIPLERQTEISLCHQVKPGIVPTLLFHGTADTTVPFENAERFKVEMEKAGNECVLVPFEGKGHGFFNGSFFRKRNGDEAFNKTMEHSFEFLSKHGYLPVQ